MNDTILAAATDQAPQAPPQTEAGRLYPVATDERCPEATLTVFGREIRCILPRFHAGWHLVDAIPVDRS